VAVQIKDMTGQVFGKLTCLRFERNEKGDIEWVCQCECGGIVNVERSFLLRKKNPKVNCGCEYKKIPKAHLTKHGLSRTRIYGIWIGMKERCFNPDCSIYFKYGARGITVCDEWLDVEVFKRDMGEPPRNFSIERIDNDGPYAPWNCRWATAKEQAQNRRDVDLIEYNGMTRSKTEWAEILKINPSTFLRRIKNGMPFDQAIKKKAIYKCKKRILNAEAVSTTSH